MQGTAPRTYFDRVLCLTDLKSRSQSALSFARAFTRYYGSHLTLLHVLPEEAMEDTGSLLERRAIRAEQRCVQQLASEMVSMGLNADAWVRHGLGLREVLLKSIEIIRPDLIIQGSAGLDHIRRAFLGSVAETVFRRAAVPVLTAGPGVKPIMGRPLAFQRILFMTDFGSRRRTAAIYAVSLAQEFRARVRLCHVHDGADENGRHAEAKRFFESELNGLISADAYDWCDPECSVGFGDAEESVAKSMTEFAPDLVVLGAHGAGRLGTHGKPGIAFSVMAHAKCPVLSLADHAAKSRTILECSRTEMDVPA